MGLDLLVGVLRVVLRTERFRFRARFETVRALGFFVKYFLARTRFEDDFFRVTVRLFVIARRARLRAGAAVLRGLRRIFFMRRRYRPVFFFTWRS